MNHTWEEVYARFNNHPIDNKTWKSDRRGLLMLANYARAHDLEPDLFLAHDLCKLRFSVPSMRSAVRNRNPEKLREILQMAANSTIVELRLKLGISRPDPIQTKIVTEDGQEYVQVNFLPEQFEHLENSTKLQFEFLIPQVRRRNPFAPGVRRADFTYHSYQRSVLSG